MPFYKLDDLPTEWLNPKYSTGTGPNITGAQIEVGRRSYPAGTGAKPHAHSNEQICLVLAGKARLRIADEEQEVGPGDGWLIPAGTQHELHVIDELKIISVKNVVDGRGHRLE